MVLHLFLDSCRIDIEQRIREGGFFRVSELVQHCRRSVADQLKCDLWIQPVDATDWLNRSAGVS